MRSPPESSEDPRRARFAHLQTPESRGKVQWCRAPSLPHGGHTGDGGLRGDSATDLAGAVPGRCGLPPTGCCRFGMRRTST